VEDAEGTSPPLSFSASTFSFSLSPPSMGVGSVDKTTASIPPPPLRSGAGEEEGREEEGEVIDRGDSSGGSALVIGGTIEVALEG